MMILDAASGHPRGLPGRLGGMIMARSTGFRNAWIISLLDIQHDDHVLEVGFGPGMVIQSIAAIATEGFVAGIDASLLMVQQASSNEEAIRDGRVQLLQGSALALPFEDATFDKALSINGKWRERCAIGANHEHWR